MIKKSDEMTMVGKKERLEDEDEDDDDDSDEKWEGDNDIENIDSARQGQR